MSAPEVLYSAAEIEARVDALAEIIAADLGDDLIAVPVMTGAMVFAADLIRALWRRGVAVEVMALRVRSYGASLTAESAPVIAMPLDKRIDGRTALLIDGVCDVGHTLVTAVSHLSEMGAGRIASAVLVDKPTRRGTAARPDYVGFTAGDLFVVGYGMDARGGLRHLPYVGVIR
ncbi:MAG: phosphoribosyltransferase family protein [Micropepsaceae bacterium]